MKIFNMLNPYLRCAEKRRKSSHGRGNPQYRVSPWAVPGVGQGAGARSGRYSARPRTRYASSEPAKAESKSKHQHTMRILRDLCSQGKGAREKVPPAPHKDARLCLGFGEEEFSLGITTVAPSAHSTFQLTAKPRSREAEKCSF